MSSSDFIITRKTDQSITMSIRIDKSLQAKYDELSVVSHRSRNEIINMALKYALENLKFVDDVKGDKAQ